MDREEIKSRLPLREEFERRGVEFKMQGTRLMACCPFHDDSSPSMCVDEKEEVFLCYGCGKSGSVIDAWMEYTGVSVGEAMKQIEEHLGVSKPSRTPPAPSPKKESEPPRPQGKIVKTYDYTDEEGNLLFQVCRLEPKSFRQRVKKGDGWEYQLNGTRRVLYNLPSLIGNDLPIFFCEGEKDADLLINLGLCATTVPMGAGKWEDSYTTLFKARTVIILPDNDVPGEKHAAMICEKIGEICRAVKIVNIPKSYKDVSDWRAGFESSQKFGMTLYAMAKEAETVAGADTLPIYSMEEMEERYIKSVTSPARSTLDFTCISPRLGKLIRPLVAGDFAVIMADTGVGKTFILQNLAYKCGQKVLFFELELSDDTMFERFSAMGSGTSSELVESYYKTGQKVNWRRNPSLHQNVFVCPKPGLTLEQLRKLLIQSEMKLGCIPPVVMIDYIGLMRAPGSRYERLSDLAEGVKTLAKEMGVVILAGCQVARDKDRKSPEVYLHDAKDSGSIENSAQLALGIWRDPDPEKKTRIWTKILKNTKGVSGPKVPLQYTPSNLQIHEELTYCEEEESVSQPTSSGNRSGNSYHPRRMNSR